MNELRGVFADPEFVRLLSDARARRLSEDTGAAEQVALLRDRGVKPQLRYRCGRGRCGLFTAWNLPDGVLFAHPGFRVSEGLAAGRSWPGAQAHLTVPSTTTTAFAWPARCYVWHGNDPVFVACSHQWAQLDPASITESVQLALRTGTTVSESRPDRR